MSKIKDLKEKAAKAAAEIRKLGDAFNSEDQSGWTQEAWDAANKDYDETRSQLEILERADKVRQETEQRQDPARRAVGRPMLPNSDDEEQRNFSEQLEQRGLALSGWVRGARGLETRQEREALDELGFRPCGQGHFDFNLFPTREARSLQSIFRAGHPTDFEQRAQSALQGTLGGYLVAEGFIPRLERGLLWFGSMLQTSEIIRTTSGEDLPWPNADDASNEGALVGENEDGGDSEITFGRLVLRAHKATSKRILVPSELLQDSAIDVQSIVADMLSERLARLMNRLFTEGTGAGQPLGLLNALGTAVTPETSNVDCYDDLIDLETSVDKTARMAASYQAHDTVIGALRKVRAGADNLPIWSSGVAFGRPDTLNGYPIFTNNDYPSYGDGGTGVGRVTFGDHRKYKVRLVAGVRLLQDVKIETDQVAFVAYARFDGGLQDPGGRALKQMNVQIGPES